LTGILARRRRAEHTARDHLEASVAQRGEVEQITKPLQARDARNHLAEQVHRSLRGHRT
jgi:hypothetical protein